MNLRMTPDQMEAHKRLSKAAAVVAGKSGNVRNNYETLPAVSNVKDRRGVEIIISNLKTVSLLNQREHWSVRAKRAKEHRLEAWVMTPSLSNIKPPMAIKLTRIGPRRLDGDNLQGALKNIRDGIADRLGIDDGSALIRWSYDQESRGEGNYAVVICAREL
jgi:hypothetical protein